MAGLRTRKSFNLVSHVFGPTVLALGVRAVCWGLGVVAWVVPRLSLAQPAPATQGASVSYSIAAGPLPRVLSEVAARSGASVTYDFALVKDKLSPGVQGRYPTSEALTQVLAGTGLEAMARSSDGYVIRVKPVPPAPPPEPSAPHAPVGEATLRPITVVTDAESADFGYQDEGFSGASTRSATRTDTALSDIPQAIQIVTQEVMKTRQVQSVSDALRNVSAVGSDDAAINEDIRIRGFEARFLENGVPTLQLGDDRARALYIPMAGVERVEVLKGANSVTAGVSMKPGGIVNIVTKRPQSERVRELTLEVGAHGRQRASLDMAGTLSADRALSYRTVLLGMYAARSEFGYRGNREIYLAPSLGWRQGGTSLVVGLAYQRQRQPTPEKQYAELTPHGPGPDFLHGRRGRFDDGLAAKDVELFYELKQGLWRGWTFQSKFRYKKATTDYGLYVATGNDPDLGGWGGFSPASSSFSGYSASFENSIQGQFKTGALNHTLLAGANYLRVARSGFARRALVPDIKVPSDQYLPPVNSLFFPGERLALVDDSAVTTTHFFLQDQMAWGRWKVLASVGHVQISDPSDKTREDASGQVQDASAPRNKPVYNLGVAYRLSDSATVFANSQSSFEPGGVYFDATLNGGVRGRVVTPPVSGRSAELGVKLNLLNDRLTATASLFRATNTNVVEDVTPANAPFGRQDLVLLPSALSRGLEFDVAGRLAPGWNLTASYSYTRFEPARPAQGTAELSQTPRHRLSLWTTYDLRNEAWRGWGVGAGVTMRTGYKAPLNEMDGEGRSVYRLGAQAQVDVSIYYRSRSWSATLGIKNLFNRRLLADFASGSTVNVQPYRTVLLTGTYNF
ncbi:TonB-dependent siderophore receptor [Variovorax sp. GB1P17]|uniref:TonB-dependent siderophore receptor n=1 Tax=Variovorax sp. GB1P17 TaxID=3443740 RepID=UPI003F458B5F